MHHLGETWSVHMVSTHSLYTWSGATGEAYLNVGMDTGQSCQSARLGDDGGAETHDHFMTMMMSAMISGS